ncbi:hypothetical protein HYQ46_000638 [Verticillium longisporum]|nr:hypothetical protein HYQ46_000638 [Verticillium longisporum]
MYMISHPLIRQGSFPDCQTTVGRAALCKAELRIVRLSRENLLEPIASWNTPLVIRKRHLACGCETWKVFSNLFARIRGLVYISLAFDRQALALHLLGFLDIRH